MITVITTFKLPKPITRQEAQSNFLCTAPKYQGVAGLVRKCYVLSQDGSTVGGIYLWNSRAEAEARHQRAVTMVRYSSWASLIFCPMPRVSR